jgi:predicted DNA-binding protein
MAMTLRISHELDHRLTEYTAQSGVSKNQFILDAIEEHLDRADQRSATRKSVRRIVERDSALLERLADA